MLCRADSVGRVPGRDRGPRWPRCRGCKPRTLLRPGGRGRAHPPRADPGRFGAPLHPPPQRPGAGHLPAPAARELAGQDARRAAVPGAADADGHRRRRVHARPRPTSCARRWARSAAGRGWSSCGRGCTRAWPSGASPARSPTRSSTRWRRSPTTASPSRTRCRFAYLVYAVVVDQAPRAGGVLRGAAQRPADGLLTPALAGAGRPPPRRRGAHPRPQRLAGRGRRSSRAQESRRRRRPCGWGSARCAASAATWPSEIEAGAPVRRRWRTSCAACRRCTLPSSRRWPRPGCSASASASTGGRRCGRWARLPSRGPDRLPGIVTGQHVATLARHGSDGGGGRRPVGHRRGARRPPHPVPPRPAATRCGVVTAAGLVGRRAEDAGCSWPGVVTHRQRPMTAQGITFINLEDETGLINVVVLEGLLGPLPPGRPRRAGPADPRPPGAQRGRDQRRRRRVDLAAGAGLHGQPRLPLIERARRLQSVRCRTPCRTQRHSPRCSTSSPTSMAGPSV